MTNTSALWYFESVNLFNLLCPHKVKSMADSHAFLTVKKNEFIYTEQQPSSHVYMIVKGRVKIGHYMEDGSEAISSILTNGEIFGELALPAKNNERISRRPSSTPSFAFLPLMN